MLEDWINSRTTPNGIGIDCVCVSELRALDARLGGVFVQSAFTEKERQLAENATDYWLFLAGRFAVKEAVFKALSCKAPNPFDYRKVETLRREDGCPYVNPKSIPEAVLQRAEVTDILVTITGEGDYAIALVEILKKWNDKNI